MQQDVKYHSFIPVRALKPTVHADTYTRQTLKPQ